MLNKEKAPAATGAHVSNKLLKSDYTTLSPFRAKINLYDNAFDRIGAPIVLSDVLSQIQQGKYQRKIAWLRKLNEDDYGKHKTSLPMFTASGTFTPSRSKANFATPSGLVVLDKDGLNVSESEALREHLRSCPYTAAAFLSPRNGVKWLVRVDINNDFECKNAFRDLAGYYKNNFNIEVDPSGKDVSRACFLSADFNLWTNESAEPFVYNIKAEPIPQTPNTIELALIGSARLEKYVLTVLNGELENIVTAPKGTGTAALYRAAIRAGELDYTGLFDRPLLEDKFCQAYMQRGNSQKCTSHAAETFDNGYAHGTEQPRDLMAVLK